MAQVMFDTLAYVKKLQAGGIPKEHSESLAEATAEALTGWMHNQLATKEDIHQLDHKIDVVKKDLIIKLGGIMSGGIILLASLMLVLH